MQHLGVDVWGLHRFVMKANPVDPTKHVFWTFGRPQARPRTTMDLKLSICKPVIDSVFQGHEVIVILGLNGRVSDTSSVYKAGLRTATAEVAQQDLASVLVACRSLCNVVQLRYSAPRANKTSCWVLARSAILRVACLDLAKTPVYSAKFQVIIA